MGLVTNAQAASFFQTLDMRFQKGYQARKSYWQLFAEHCPSTTKQSVYSWLAELPGMRKWTGPKIVRNLKSRAYTLKNEDWEVTYEIDRNELEDDVAGIWGNRAQLEGDAAARWPDDIVTDQLLTGTTTTAFDGQNFFSGAHPVDVDDTSLGTYSNNFTSTALTKANYNTVFAAMMGYKGESGKPLEVQPTILMVPPSLRETARQIANAELIAQEITQGGSNVGGAAVTNVFKGEVTVIVNPRLAGDVAGTWYLMSTDRMKPLIFQERKPPTPVTMIDPNLPGVFNQRKLQWGREARGAAGVGLPFLIARATP